MPQFSGFVIYTLFFNKQDFYTQHQTEIGKKSNTKQHLKAELLTFFNYSHS